MREFGVAASCPSPRRDTSCHRRRVSWSPRLLPVVLTLLAFMFGETSAASAAALKAMWGPGVHDGASVFPAYRELGVKVYEDVLRWNAIAPRRPHHARDPRDPAYVWPAEVTRAVAEAKRYGMKVALEIIGSPRWANGGLSPAWVPLRLSYYADFAVAAAR